jgi:hypothetical protein
MFDDTALLRMIIEDLAIKYKWTYEDSIEKFYHSNTCKSLSDMETGIFTFAPGEIIAMFEDEMAANSR